MPDSDALADLIAELIGEHVDRATAPLLLRIADLEARDATTHLTWRLDQVEQGLPTLIEQAVAAGVEARMADVPVPRDGRDADPEVVRSMVAAAVAAIPAPQDGAPGRDGANGRNGHDVEDIVVTQDGAVIEFAFVVGDTRSTFEIELPAGPAGEPGRDGQDGAPGRDGENGRDGADGKLPVARVWTDEVHYEGDVVTFEGATYQALRDTGRAPASVDWICLAAGGAAGRDATGFAIRGTWSAEHTYQAFDVVALNGASFVAKFDAPGQCPGEGWQLMAAQGKRGLPGERGVGAQGQRGEPGPPVVAATIDDMGLLSLVNGDGSTVNCDLYPVLSRAAQ